MFMCLVCVCLQCLHNTKKSQPIFILPTQTYFTASTHKHMVRTNIGKVKDKKNSFKLIIDQLIFQKQV